MKYFVTDAFASEVFHGNPAGVCLLENGWPSPATMQHIAAENRLSETAFVSQREDGDFDIRYFTPGSEVALCGHATLGASFVLSRFFLPDCSEIRFHTREEEVSTRCLPDGQIQLDFPVWQPEEIPATREILHALNGLTPQRVLATADLVCVVRDPETVRTFQPDAGAISALSRYRGLLLTAPGQDCDFVCRTFFPGIAIPEDPVCGSAQCSLIPLWASTLGRNRLVCRQLSSRTGTLCGELAGSRVHISGSAALYLRGEIFPGQDS